jgi:hypothetical protein
MMCISAVKGDKTLGAGKISMASLRCKEDCAKIVQQETE